MKVACVIMHASQKIREDGLKNIQHESGTSLYLSKVIVGENHKYIC